MNDFSCSSIEPKAVITPSIVEAKEKGKYIPIGIPAVSEEFGAVK